MNMYHFNDSTTLETLPGISATLIHADSASENQSFSKNEDIKNVFQGFSARGTGIYAQQKFQAKEKLSFKINFDAPQEPMEFLCDIQILWVRSQDNDSVTAMCIRQMVFDTYEKMGVKLDEKLLNRLYNQSRESTADLIKIFGISEAKNRLELEEFIESYWSAHPATNYRYGAKITSESAESWKKVIAQVSIALSQNKTAASEYSSDTLKRRSAHR